MSSQTVDQYCTKCGSAVSVGDGFCVNCGYQVMQPENVSAKWSSRGWNVVLLVILFFIILGVPGLVGFVVHRYFRIRGYSQRVSVGYAAVGAFVALVLIATVLAVWL